MNFFSRKPFQTNANELFSTNDLAGTNESPSTLPVMDPLPWGENWQLDEEFFRDMRVWNAQHPQSTLMKVMGKVNETVTQHKMVLEFIPNAPFPAGSLVKGLAYLLELGVVGPFLVLKQANLDLLCYFQKVARAKQEV